MRAFRQIDALQEYALVDPEQRTVEVFRRTETGDWLLATRDSKRRPTTATACSSRRLAVF